ncbi:hypothetical protein PG988_014510 [Apiospora saccharicola]
MYHVTVAHGSDGPWSLKPSLFNGMPSRALTSLNIFDLPFFMGLVFWICVRVMAQLLAKAALCSFVNNKTLSAVLVKKTRTTNQTSTPASLRPNVHDDDPGDSTRVHTHGKLSTLGWVSPGQIPLPLRE